MSAEAVAQPEPKPRSWASKAQLWDKAEKDLYQQLLVADWKQTRSLGFGSQKEPVYAAEFETSAQAEQLAAFLREQARRRDEPPSSNPPHAQRGRVLATQKDLNASGLYTEEQLEVARQQVANAAWEGKGHSNSTGEEFRAAKFETGMNAIEGLLDRREAQLSDKGPQERMSGRQTISIDREHDSGTLMLSTGDAKRMTAQPSRWR